MARLMPSWPVCVCGMLHLGDDALQRVTELRPGHRHVDQRRRIQARQDLLLHHNTHDSARDPLQAAHPCIQRFKAAC